MPHMLKMGDHVEELSNYFRRGYVIGITDTLVDVEFIDADGYPDIEFYHIFEWEKYLRIIS